MQIGVSPTLAQTIFTDSAVATELDANRSGSSGTALQYIIGNTVPYDTDFGNTEFRLQDYTQLTIQNGSTVDNNGDMMAYFVGDNSTLTVTGANSELLLKTTTTASGIVFNNNTSGNTVQVLDGGYILAGTIYMWGNLGNSGSIEIDGTDSIFQTNQNPNLKGTSVLTVDISNGGLWAAKGFGTTGDITVNLNSGGSLQVSESFDASNIDTFTFNSGGTLIAQSSLTNLNSTSAGQTVILDGGTWSPSGDIGTGNTTLQNNGSLSVGDYDATNLTFTSGTLSASGALTNLPELVSGNNVDISGGGSFGDATTLNGGSVNTAAFDATNLTFTSGTLTTTGALTNLGTISSGQIVDISGGGSFASATTLGGGNLSTNDFDLTNLTFTSGTLTTTGALTNLNSLSSANQSVVIDGGTWSPSGNIDTGNLTIQNDGSVSVTDYSATNLNLASGTLNVSGTLTGHTTLGTNATARVNGGLAALVLLLDETLALNGGTLEISGGATANPLGSGAITFDGTNGGEIALDGGTLNVASMGSTLTLNANATITGNGSIYGDIGLGVGGTIAGDATGLEVFGHISGSGTLTDLTLYGNLDIGNSPGEINLEGVTLGSGSEVFMEIMGTEIGQYDILTGDAFTDVSGADLSIVFSAYIPNGTESWQLISGDMDPLSFANISTPDGWTLSDTGLLSVPEPATYGLLSGLVALGFVILRRRERAVSNFSVGLHS
jgi:hypothetical protein